MKIIGGSQWLSGYTHELSDVEAWINRLRECSNVAVLRGLCSRVMALIKTTPRAVDSDEA
jgi:hypothetical protein